jgi:hypothetical protein
VVVKIPVPIMLATTRATAAVRPRRRIALGPQAESWDRERVFTDGCELPKG